MRVDLPLPLTPVTHTNIPNGRSRSTPFRLLPEAPFSSICLRSLFGRRLGSAISRCRERYSKVKEELDVVLFLISPAKRIFPPCTPAPGPMSTR